MIKHLVLSAGGPAGLLTYGAAKTLALAGFWRLRDIKSMYGCSIGAYLAVIFALDYEWAWLDDYFVQRPWEKVFALSAQQIMDAFEQKGLLGLDVLTETIAPLLTAKGLPVTTTLQEFYEFSHIELHFSTTNVNTPRLQKIDLSHLTHPQLPVITALCMSMAYPLLVKPVIIGADCFIDGGLLNRFPLNDCLEQQQAAPDSILAFKNIWDQPSKVVTSASTVLDYLSTCVHKLAALVDTEPQQGSVKHMVRCLVEDLSGVEAWRHAVSTAELRAKFIRKGEVQGQQFLDYHAQIQPVPVPAPAPLLVPLPVPAAETEPLPLHVAEPMHVAEPLP
jgi:predicted acylesterase/phospholipase RssA